MRITQWLAENQIKLRLVNEEAIKQKVKMYRQEEENVKSFHETDLYKQAEALRLQKELNYKRAENLLAIKPKARKESVKNVNNYNPFIEYEAEYGHLTIYDEFNREIAKHYDKKPTSHLPLTHTFDIPAHTTVTRARFVTDSGEEMKIDRGVVHQRFYSAGTYTITLNYTN